MFSFVIIPSPLLIPHRVSSTSLQWPLVQFLYIERCGRRKRMEGGREGDWVKRNKFDVKIAVISRMENNRP